MVLNGFDSAFDFETQEEAFEALLDSRTDLQPSELVRVIQLPGAPPPWSTRIAR